MFFRKKVKWLEGQKPQIKQNYMHPLVEERPIDDHINSVSLREGAVLGALWFTHCAMTVDTRFTTSGYQSHEAPYIIPDLAYGYNSLNSHIKPTILPGSIAIYSGTIRVNEMSDKGNIFCILRHSFVINGVRYLTSRIGQDFFPA